MAKSSKQDERFRDKLKHLFGIGSGKGSSNVHGGNIRHHPREFFFTTEIIKDISQGTPANHRMKSIRDLFDVVQNKRLEDNAVEVLWTAIKDLLQPEVSREDRCVALRFLQYLVEGQYEQLGVMRAHFFRVIQAYDIFEDLPLRLDLFRTLTCDGKDLLYFEEEAGAFLLEWMKDVISSSCISTYLVLLINVVKFNAAYLDEDVTVGLVLNTCLIATRSGNESDIKLCLQLLDTVICYSYLPAAALHQFILCLCRVVNIAKFCETSWMLMRKLLGTHLGHSGIYRMCCILQDRNNISESGAILLRGAVFFIGMALWGSKKVSSLKHPSSAVLPSFQQALTNSNSGIVAYEIVLSVQRLVGKYGRDQQMVTWDIILDIVEALLKHVENTAKPNPLLVSNIHDLLTSIEELAEQGHYHGSPDRFFAIIETCANKRTETSILALVSHKAQAVHPSRDGWVTSLYHLVDKYFKQEGRTQIRSKVLDILSDVLSANRMLHEDELIEKVVLPHLQHIENDPDLEVKKRAAHLLVDLAQTCTSAHCLDILALLQKVINHPLNVPVPASPLQQPAEGAEMPVRLSHKLDDVMVAVTGLIGVFQCKLYQQPSSHAQCIYEVLVGHLEAHYGNEHMLRKGGSIREAIFTFLLALRGDGLLRLGLPSKSRQSQICYSPYIQCAERPDPMDHSLHAEHTTIGALRSSPYTASTKTAVAPYAHAFRCIRTCLEQETNWRVLEVVMANLPDVLHNKTLLLAAYTDDIDRFCVRLCDMVSNKGLVLTAHYSNTPDKFQKSDFHSYIFPVLTCLVAYHNVLEKRRQSELLRCLEFGLVSRKALICVRALTVCALEMQDIMRRQLPAVLLRLSQISATVAMAIPLMEFLSSLIRLPKLYANFVEEEYMSVFAIALPYTNPFKYNHYTVSLAYHVIAMWFLKCKLPFRKRFVGFIVKGLRANVLRQFDETALHRVRQNQDSSDRNRTHSLNDDTLKKDRFRAFSMNDERLRNQAHSSHAKHRGSWDLSYQYAGGPHEALTKAAAARAKAQGVQAAQQAVAAAGLTSSSAPPTPSSEDQAKMQFHRELMETCIDALARYTFSTCASMPKRTPATDFLLAGGQSQSWLLANRIITISTSGGAKVTKSGLCDNCLAMARSQAISKVNEENAESSSGGRKRHRSAAVRSSSKAVSLKPSSQDDLLIHKHSPDGTATEIDLAKRSDTPLTLPEKKSSAVDNSTVARRVSVGNREEKMQLVDNVLMGLKAKPSDTSIFSPHMCNCWCTQWAEIHIRRTTGNISWMMRIQNTQDLAEAFPEFPLDDISNMFMNPPEDSFDKLTSRRKIDSTSLGDNEYDSLLEEHFSGGSSHSGISRLPALEASPPEESELPMLVQNGKKDEGESESSFPKSSSSSDLAPVMEEHPNVGSSPPDNKCITGSPRVKECTDRPSTKDTVQTDPPVFKSNADDSEQVAVNVIIKDILPPLSPRTTATTGMRRADDSGLGSPHAGGHEPSGSPSSLSRSISINTDDHEHLSSHPRHGSGKTMFSSPAGSPQPHRSPDKSPTAAAQRSRAASCALGNPPTPPSPTKNRTPHFFHQDSDSSHDRERSQTISVMSPRRSMMRTSSAPVEPRRPGSFDAGFPSGSSSTTPTKPLLPPHGGVSPSFLFLQLYHSSLLDSGPGRPLELPKTPMVDRAVKMLDLMYPYETHKVGVVYVGEGQTHKEVAILSNHHGSARYVEFLQGLGHLICLSDCNQDTIYVGGLDVKGNDGQFAYAWHDDFMQVIYHVATLMPDKEKDPNCNAKKLHIGNDYVSIVYNDSKENYKMGTIKCQFNYVNIVVTPLDHESSAVQVQTRIDIQDIIGHTDTKIISDANLALLVRQMAVHANLASHILQRQQTNPQDPYASNWLERLRQIKKVRQKVAQNADGAKDKQQISTPIVEDFTDFV